MLLLGAVVVSTFGYLSGMTLAVPRALFAFARDGFLPAAVAAVHPRFRTPHVSIAVQTALACTLAITSAFGPLAIISNVAALLVLLRLRGRRMASFAGATLPPVASRSGCQVRPSYHSCRAP